MDVAARRPSTWRRVIEAVRPLNAAKRSPVLEPAVTSIYSAINYQQDRSVLLVGERTNANGSKKFREAMLEGDWDTCVDIGREQIKEGAHVIDVCVDYTGADGVSDMNELISRLATQSSVPIMIDTTEAPVARQALTWLGGKAMLNSVNLEEGDGAGHSPRRLPHPRRRVRRGRRRHLHRRRGPGAHGRLEGPRRAGDHRTRGHALRARRARTSSSTRWPCRCRRAWSSRAATASRPSRRSAGSRPSFPACARSSDCPTSPSASTRRARQVLNSVFLHECRRGRPRRGDRARVQTPAAAPHRRRGPPRLPRPHLRPAQRRLRPAHRPARSLRGRLVVERGDQFPRRPAELNDRLDVASSTARASASKATSTPRWPRAWRRSTS